jgi:hypothetical protein
MSDSKYHYVVSEIHLNNNTEKVVSQRVFDWKDKDLTELKNLAHRYFNERKRLIEFWTAQDIYEIGEDQISELNIKLVEASEGGTREILTKSLTNVVGQSNLDYEKKVIQQDRRHRIEGVAIADNNDSSGSLQKHIETPRSQLKELKVKDYYQILGLGYDATSEQIEKAYSVRQSLAGGSMWHPNWHPGKSTYSNMEVYYKAYVTLSNPLARAKYDEGIIGKIEAAATLRHVPEPQMVSEPVNDMPVEDKPVIKKQDTIKKPSKKFSFKNLIRRLFGRGKG